jgi:hypothetical protein
LQKSLKDPSPILPLPRGGLIHCDEKKYGQAEASKYKRLIDLLNPPKDRLLSCDFFGKINLTKN